MTAFTRRSRLVRLRARWGVAHERTHALSFIRQSHRDRVDETNSPTPIDDRTWSDLDFDAIFAALDRTESTLGQHALFHRLRTPDLSTLPAFEALVERFTNDARAREEAQLALSALQDAHGYNLWWLNSAEAVPMPSRWHAAFPILSLCCVAAVAAGFLLHTFAWVAVTLVFAYAVNITTLQRDDADPAALRQVAPLIAAAQALPPLFDNATACLLRGLDEIDRLAALKSVARWAGDNPLLLAPGRNGFAVMANDLLKACYEYLDLFFLIDRVAVFFGRKRLHEDARLVIRVLAALGEVDAALSVASLRAESANWTRPHFVADGPATMTELRHPLIHDAVPNSITVRPPHGVLVTGSNMSGKSTLLRTVGVATVMAQSLNTCFAATYQAPPFRVHSVIGRADDIVAGKSYYLVEVEALLALVRRSASTDPHLFLLDELFRGTNAVERIAAGEAVLRELISDVASRKTHVAIAATHDGELVDLLADCYTPYHFGDSIGPNGLVFDYRLAPGPATTRNAITLLQLQGAPDGLVDRAMHTASRLDRDRATSRARSDPAPGL